jgi:DNA (cytosine-5)-methyltransferase 1
MEGRHMVSYNRLWHKLLDLKMNKTELRAASGISTSTLAKLGKNEIVSLEVLEKICETLNCDLGDIASFVEEDEKSNG